MGDALNWEWIVYVAQKSGKDIAIVSRDADYGIEIKDKTYINDWLIQEFRDRVAKKRKLTLHTRLSPALKLANIKVTKKAEKDEKDFVEGSVAVKTIPMDSNQELLIKMLRGWRNDGNVPDDDV